MRKIYEKYKEGVEKRGGTKVMPFHVFEIVFFRMVGSVERRFPHAPVKEQYATALNVCVKTTIDFEKFDGDFKKYLISKQSRN